jgi:ABC-type nitrate/sulfonate/bicarbonate transport system substrate-binding protein
MSERLKLIAFPGAPNLPIFVARERGWFEKNGIDLDMTLTPSSSQQAEALARGDYDIAGTAFDNVVAYCEGQGAVKLPEAPDFFAFLGATQIELAVAARPEIKTIADLSGKQLALDAPGTGFAFVLYHMLEHGGLTKSAYEPVASGATPQRWEAVKEGRCAATMTIEPFTSIARANGFNILARSTDTLADYQGGVFAATRGRAAQKRAQIVGFVRSYLEGLGWCLDAAHREEAAEILQRNMPEIQPRAISSVMASLLSPRSGLTPRGEPTLAGAQTVLDLRRRYGQKGAQLRDASAYFDLAYLREAEKA